ncbi:efflux RND transporter periplasmic adaptor subunit [Acidobacteria bacterium AH-259-G07]|nr:efflux RND transporter periplasmic adaptor subunit [Acidobacteria bacterium AH-259-G07]
MSKKLSISLILASTIFAGALAYFWSQAAASWLRETFTGEHQLVPVKAEHRDIKYWTCTMHPSVRMKEPGTCPICAMDLVPVTKTSPATSGNVSTNSGEQIAADQSTFTVDPRRQQLINVHTTPVEVRPLEKVIRTVAILELDETRIQHVRTKIKGWINEVFVNYTLQHVEKGDPLFSIYSPELVATQDEYLLALRTAEDLSSSPFAHVSDGARSLFQATHRRLQLFDITEKQIQDLEKTGEVQKYLIIHSPVTGHVTERNAFANMYVTPETNVYTIADYSRIWAQVEIYENDIPHVWKGQLVVMTTAAYPGRIFRGRVAYLYPHLNEKTRTMRVRLEFPNRDLKLKPEMYANAEMKVPLGRHVAVPESAVLRTGKRDLVFVDLGSGQMQLRRVKVGAKAGGYYEILKGLRPREKVVSAANFLIDAESKVQGVEASWETPKPR